MAPGIMGLAGPQFARTGQASFVYWAIIEYCTVILIIIDVLPVYYCRVYLLQSIYSVFWYCGGTLFFSINNGPYNYKESMRIASISESVSEH
jgi:hypothetical protein